MHLARIVLQFFTRLLFCAAATAAARASCVADGAIERVAERFSTCILATDIQSAARHYLSADGLVASSKWGVLSSTQTPSRTVENPRVVAWRVVSHEVSRAADLAFTRGAWRGHHGLAGDYFAVWVRNEKNSARLQFLLLTTREITGPAPPEYPSAMQPALQTSDVATAVRLAEGQFGGLCGASGMATAFAAQGSDSIHVLRDGADSLAGLKNVVADPAVASERWRYTPMFTYAAKSRDLAVTFGRYALARDAGVANNFAERGYFARSWIVQSLADAANASSWKISADAAAATSR